MGCKQKCCVARGDALLLTSAAGMRATFLGSNGLAVRVRCPCGRKVFIDKRAGSARCDNCRAFLLYNGLMVLDELNYERTEERVRILGALDDLQRRAEALAKTVADSGSAHRVRNVAQSVASQRSLLEQDWHLGDAAAAKKPAA